MLFAFFGEIVGGSPEVDEGYFVDGLVGQSDDMRCHCGVVKEGAAAGEDATEVGGGLFGFVESERHGLVIS